MHGSWLHCQQHRPICKGRSVAPVGRAGGRRSGAAPSSSRSRRRRPPFLALQHPVSMQFSLKKQQGRPTRPPAFGEEDVEEARPQLPLPAQSAEQLQVAIPGLQGAACCFQPAAVRHRPPPSAVRRRPPPPEQPQPLRHAPCRRKRATARRRLASGAPRCEGLTPRWPPRRPRRTSCMKQRRRCVERCCCCGRPAFSSRHRPRTHSRRRALRRCGWRLAKTGRRCSRPRVRWSCGQTGQARAGCGSGLMPPPLGAAPAIAAAAAPVSHRSRMHPLPLALPPVCASCCRGPLDAVSSAVQSRRARAVASLLGASAAAGPGHPAAAAELTELRTIVLQRRAGGGGGAAGRQRAQVTGGPAGGAAPP